MTKLFLAVGVAALAIAAPVAAERGGKGGGDKGQAAKVHGGGGGGNKAARAPSNGGGNKAFRAENRGGGGKAFRAENRGGGGKAFRAENRGGGAKAFRAESRGGGKAQVRAERRVRDDVRKAFKGERRGGDQVRTAKVERKQFRDQNRIDRRQFNVANRDLRGRDNRNFNDVDNRWANSGLGHPLIDGCPPGLASKNVLCMPPGQYRNRVLGQALPAAYADRLLPEDLRDYYLDNDDYYYRLGNGYVYQVNRDTSLIAALLPLLGGGLGVGQAFPTSYMNSFVPNDYQAFYPDTQDDYYRFSNGYVYEIDRNSGLIDNIIPSYASGYGMGQMLPSSYSYYNLPEQYRDIYADNDDQYYRYAPGAIYQVDRGTNLITSVASLLAGDLSLGQQLPMGYDAYNVPLAYRDQYQDSPDSWYRYNDGNIYQVDPTTRLITAVIQALV